MSPITVDLRPSRGVWEVASSAERPAIRCETLDEARRVAYRCAARDRPCELIIHDAYNRVLAREFVDAPTEPADL